MSSSLSSPLSRRNLLKLMGVALTLSACAPASAPAGEQAAAAGEGAAAPTGDAIELVMMYHAGEIPDPLIQQFNEDYAPINNVDRAADYLYLPECIYLVVLVSLAVTGGGAYSLDAFI